MDGSVRFTIFFDRRFFAFCSWFYRALFCCMIMALLLHIYIYFVHNLHYIWVFLLSHLIMNGFEILFVFAYMRAVAREKVTKWWTIKMWYVINVLGKVSAKWLCNIEGGERKSLPVKPNQEKKSEWLTLNNFGNVILWIFYLKFYSFELNFFLRSLVSLFFWFFEWICLTLNLMWDKNRNRVQWQELWLGIV